MPEALVVPPTPSLPSNILVSLIIEASASENISIAANKKKLEDNLASYYEEKKQLTPVTATVSQTCLFVDCIRERQYNKIVARYLRLEGAV